MEEISATIQPIFVSDDNYSEQSFRRVAFSLSLDTKNPLKKKKKIVRNLYKVHVIFSLDSDYSLEACTANYNTQFETLKLI